MHFASFALRLCSAAAFLSGAWPAAGAGPRAVPQAENAPSPDRIAAFNRTLREVGDQVPPDDDLRFEARYIAPPFLPAPRARDETRDVVVPLGGASSDPVRDERFLLQGREKDFEDAAEKWAVRSLTPKSATGTGHRRLFAPKLSWHGGPVAGFRGGPVTVTAGEDRWGVRFSRSLRHRPGWQVRVSVGQEDGENHVAFSLGRSLLRSFSR